MKTKVLLLLIVMSSVVETSFGQNQKKIDSLQTLLNAAKEDTTRLRLYMALCGEGGNTKDIFKYGQAAVTLADNILSKTGDDNLRIFILKQKAEAFKHIGIFYQFEGDTSKPLEYFQKQVLILEEIKDSLGIIKSFLGFGQYYKVVGNIPRAIAHFQKALAKARNGNYKQQIAICLYQMGFLYKEQDYKPQALENFQKGLTLFYELKDTATIIEALSQTGRLYSDMHNVVNALDCFNKAILLSEATIKDKRAIRYLYNCIAEMYQDNKNYPRALEFFQKTISQSQEWGDKGWIAGKYRNLGTIYRLQGDFSKALDYQHRSLQLLEAGKYESDVMWANLDLAITYEEQKNYKKAKFHCEKAYVMLKNRFDVKSMCNVERLSGKIDSALGNYKEAFYHYQQYITLRDKLNSEEVRKAATREKYQNEYDMQKTIDKEEQAKLDAIALAKKQQQQFVIYTVAGVLLIVMVFSALLYKRFRFTNKQKQIIEIKSKEVEEHQKEIIDSITYAKRLQQAILPSLAGVKEHLPNSFVYYQPKDIVAGDFYWMHTTPLSGGRRTGGELTFIAAADCTGHGVPGAMVSVVCSNALNRAVNEFNLTDTGLILDKTRELVIETFEKSDSEVKDGMDISLLRIKKQESGNKIEIQWSGANNSLWYVLNNDLIEVKADKQPIGKYSEPTPFTTHNISLSFGEGRGEAGCTFYLFSDGYADQFSANDKKLMKKKFKEIVLSNQNLSIQEQGHQLEKMHIDWKGTMEQTDDVLVIGVKV